jgi:hypothetical protein
MDPDKNKNRTLFRDEGRYVLLIERAVNAFRMSRILFIIEGSVRSGAMPEYEGMAFSFVCNLTNRVGVWHARSIAAAVNDTEIASLARRAWNRARDLDFEKPSDEEQERKNDEEIAVSPSVPIILDVKEKLLRAIRGYNERRILCFDLSKA